MALRKIKGEKRDGFVNLRLPEELMQAINIIAFLDNTSGTETVNRAIRELAERESHRIAIVRAAVEATKTERV